MSEQVTDAMVAAGASVLYRMELAFATEEYWAKEVYRAMLAAAPASPQPQGADDFRTAVENFMGWAQLAFLWSAHPPLSGEVEEFRKRYWIVKNMLHEKRQTDLYAPHPQPSGDGLSEETLREMLAQAIKDRGPLSNDSLAALLRDPTWTPDKESLWRMVLTFARAVEARVRSTPTDEWRRAVEACAKVAESRIEGWNPGAQACDEAALIAKGIRALSPTKPDDDWQLDAARYQFLRNFHFYFYPEKYEIPSPREFGIAWEWQDRTPDRPSPEAVLDEEMLVYIKLQDDDGITGDKLVEQFRAALGLPSPPHTKEGE